MVERENPAITAAGRTAAWMAAALFVYVTVAIALYVSFFSITAPVDVHSESKSFWISFDIIFFAHHLLSLVSWIALARWLRIYTPVVVILSAVGLFVLFVATSFVFLLLFNAG